MEKEYLDVTKRVVDKYKELFPKRSRDNESLIIRRLTKDWILGTMDTTKSNETYQVRYYYDIKLVVNIENSCIVGIFHNKGGRKVWVNPIEEYTLNKLYGLNN